MAGILTIAVEYLVAGLMAAVYGGAVVWLVRRWKRGGGRGWVAWLALAVCGLMSLAGAVTVVRHAHDHDYISFYVAGRLAGKPELYNGPIVPSPAGDLHPTVSDMPFQRLPIYASVLIPLSWLELPTARVAWGVVNAAALIGGILLWPGLSGRLRYGALAFFPCYYVLLLGQDTALVLLLCALAARRLAAEDDVSGGLLLSACAIKFSLGLALPAVLLAQRRWKAMAWAAAGIAVMMLASTLVQGTGWWLAYAARLRQAPMDGPGRMPNLRGLLQLLPGKLALELAGAAVVLWLVYRCSRSIKLPAAMAAGFAAGQYLSHHGYSYDAVAMLPLAILALADARTLPWAVLLLAPFQFLACCMPDYWIPVLAGDMGVIFPGIAILALLRTAKEPAKAPPFHLPRWSRPER